MSYEGSIEKMGLSCAEPGIAAKRNGIGIDVPRPITPPKSRTDPAIPRAGDADDALAERGASRHGTRLPGHKNNILKYLFFLN